MFCPTCNGHFADGTFCPKDGTALLPDGQPMESLVGQVIDGRYRLVKRLGQGGMGEVYAAQHIHITKRVAVKLLHPEISSNPEALARFRQEAQSASSIGHQNIVLIDDFGTMDDGRVYLCMEFLEGQSLADALRAPEGVDTVRALDIMLQVADGLSAAHKKGIIHRDMKPENVFLTRRPDGTEIAKILDFGIAKVNNADKQENLTRTGTVFGTPHYMSPEQALGQKLDQRADVYSVGVMLFEIFTGQVPFKSESFMGILTQHITKPPPVPHTMTPGKEVPLEIEEIILRAMAKEPDKRFASMEEMHEALKKVRDKLTKALPRVSDVKTMAFGASLGKAVAASASVSASASASASASVSAPAASPSANDIALAATMAPPSAMAVAPTMATSPGPAVAGFAPTMADAAALPGGPDKLAAQGVMTSGPASVIPKTVLSAPVPSVDVSQPVFEEISATASTSRAKKKSATGLIVGLVIGTLVIVGGAVAGWQMLGNKAETNKDSTTTVTAAPTPTSTQATAPAPVQTAPEKSTTNEPAPTVKSRGAKPIATGAAAVPPTKIEEKAQPAAVAKAEPKAEPKPEPKAEPKPEPKAEPKPEPKPEPKAEPKAEPAKDHYEVRLDSDPSDAKVLRDGRGIGRTPMVLKVRPGESIRLMLAHGGFADKAVTVSASADKSMTVKLSRRSVGAGAGAGDDGADLNPSADPFK